jgi:hypothetical protein
MERQIDINALIDRVVTDKVEIQVIIDPDRIEVNIQPWKPYEMKCPYGNTPKEDA